MSSLGTSVDDQPQPTDCADIGAIVDAVSGAGALVVGVGDSTKTGGLTRLPHPVPALAAPEAAPIPTAAMTATARPAVARTRRFGAQDVPLFFDFIFCFLDSLEKYDPPLRQAAIWLRRVFVQDGKKIKNTLSGFS
jgi:hypothetical protein